MSLTKQPGQVKQRGRTDGYLENMAQESALMLSQLNMTIQD